MIVKSFLLSLQPLDYYWNVLGVEEGEEGGEEEEEKYHKRVNYWGRNEMGTEVGVVEDIVYCLMVVRR